MGGLASSGRDRPFIAMMLALLVSAQMPPAPGAEGLDLWLAELEWSAAHGRAGSPQPNLALVAVPVLQPDEDTGEIDAEALWDFLVGPETPWIEVRAALARLAPFHRYPALPSDGLELERERIRGAFVGELRRFVEALDDLREEELLHGFGLRSHPESSVDFGKAGFEQLKGRVRPILGRAWTLPLERSGYPIWWEEQAAAPWPWRLQRTLEDLWRCFAPGSPRELSEPWIEACLELPWETDAEARRFMDASVAATHHSSIAVLARWRAIALKAELPRAAELVAASGLHREWWDADDARLASEAVALELLAESPHECVRWAMPLVLTRLEELAR